MTHRLRIIDAAKADLDLIRRYTLASFGHAQTRKYMSGLREAFKILRHHPDIGYPVDLIREGYRCYHVAHHRIFYSQTADCINVVAVIHERQLPTRHLAQRKDET